ncbi:MAG: hypothetical protein SXV54_25540 [Chloroflexota bacterium]|nr:hypothetical protein [Chloroflexota bacterium]
MTQREAPAGQVTATPSTGGASNVESVLVCRGTGHLDGVEKALT